VHQHPFVGQVSSGPAGGAHSVDPDSPGEFGEITLGTVKRQKGKETGKGKENGGKRNQVKMKR